MIPTVVPSGWQWPAEFALLQVRWKVAWDVHETAAGNGMFVVGYADLMSLLNEVLQPESWEFVASVVS